MTLPNEITAEETRAVIANGKAAEKSREEQSAYYDEVMARYPDMPLAMALAMAETEAVAV
ncbi:hypothetical protein [uncultured Sphingorhabdus sp.]|uniref:hypothetical protein n=1 Tax=uncultured Sphingorhabdus sp. TaxID=1686106 RepID=UPI0026350BA3|nr:hypothetical protein [uncultured Sphingorhabdus sp.]HMS21511.1 hypothetical protein [Sphingorhabdus sp.]